MSQRTNERTKKAKIKGGRKRINEEEKVKASRLIIERGIYSVSLILIRVFVL